MKTKLKIFEIIYSLYRDASIGKKLNIGLITALLIPLATFFIYSVFFFGNKIKKEALDKNISNLNQAYFFYKNEILKYKLLVSSLVEDKEIVSLLSSNQNRRVIVNLAEKLSFSFVEYDMAHVLNKKSQIISRVHNPTLTFRDNLEKSVYFTSALEGEGVSGTEILKRSFLKNERIIVDESEKEYKKHFIAIQVSAPIYDRDENEIIGVLMLTKILNSYQSFLLKLSNQTNENISIYQDNTFVVGCFSDSCGDFNEFSKRNHSLLLLPAQVEKTIADGFRKQHSSIFKGFIFGFQPLYNVQGDVIGSLAVESSVKQSQLAFLYGFLSFLLITILGLWLAFRIRKILTTNILSPIQSLYRGTQILAKGDYSHRIEVQNKDEIGGLSKAFNRMAKELNESHTQLEGKINQRTLELVKKTEQLEQTLDMLNPGVSQLINSGKHDLGLVSATEFINDVCDYTRLNLLLSEEFIGNFINHYYQESHKILAMYRGFRDKTVGDQTLACFGITKDAFATSEHHAFDAVNAAMEINKLIQSMDIELKKYIQKNRKIILKNSKVISRELDNVTFQTRTGINTSLLNTNNDVDQLRMVMMGGLTGSDYTGQGGALIYAARLETSGIGGEIHIGKNTADKIKNFFNLERLKSIRLKGLEVQERYKVINRKYFFEKFGKNAEIQKYKKNIPSYIYQAINNVTMGYISIKEVAKVIKKIPISINYYEHCSGRYDVILSRSLLLYALCKKIEMQDMQIQNLILAYIIYKANQLNPKNFILLERMDLLPVFKEHFKIQDLGPIKEIILHLTDTERPNILEKQLIQLIETYDSQLIDRTFLQKNKSLLLPNSSEFHRKYKNRFNNYHLEHLTQLFSNKSIA